MATTQHREQLEHIIPHYATRYIPNNTNHFLNRNVIHSRQQQPVQQASAVERQSAPSKKYTTTSETHVTGAKLVLKTPRTLQYIKTLSTPSSLQKKHQQESVLQLSTSPEQLAHQITQQEQSKWQQQQTSNTNAMAISKDISLPTLGIRLKLETASNAKTSSHATRKKPTIITNAHLHELLQECSEPYLDLLYNTMRTK